MISNIIIDTVENVIPLKTVKIKSKKVNKPWISRELLQHIKERHKLYKKCLRKPITMATQYKEYKNRVNTMLKEAKHQYLEQKS